MLSKTLAASIAAAVLASGCAFEHPTADQFAYINPPRFYESMIKSHFQPLLKDPESARYDFGAPARAYANNGSLRGGDVAWRGYAVPVRVNAKNSYGGYTGGKDYIILFNGDQPIHETTPYDPLFHWFN
ncbi:hypothetical protein [Paraburkholderia atlantica]|uniref:hypothetical protein n=1 Tax=Paraburkholderia atlantica TaxID=2654982 RepID=UPI00037FCA7D|nr:hypothetical protein [Paraburkholderia atlantica]